MKPQGKWYSQSWDGTSSECFGRVRCNISWSLWPLNNCLSWGTVCFRLRLEHPFTSALSFSFLWWYSDTLFLFFSHFRILFLLINMYNYVCNYQAYTAFALSHFGFLCLIFFHKDWDLVQVKTYSYHAREAACLKEGVLEMLTEFHIITKTSICEDPILFHLICRYSMFWI